MADQDDSPARQQERSDSGRDSGRSSKLPRRHRHRPSSDSFQTADSESSSRTHRKSSAAEQEPRRVASTSERESRPEKYPSAEKPRREKREPRADTERDRGSPEREPRRKQNSTPVKEEPRRKKSDLEDRPSKAVKEEPRKIKSDIEDRSSKAIQEEPSKIKSDIEERPRRERTSLEGESRREGNSKGHRRHTPSIASEESYDSPGPSTPSNSSRLPRISTTPRIVGTDSIDQPEPSTPSPNQLKPAATALESPSQAPKTPTFKSSSPRQVYRRHTQPKKEEPKLDDNAPKQPAEPEMDNQKIEDMAKKEDSTAQTPQPAANGGDSENLAKVSVPTKTNGANASVPVTEEAKEESKKVLEQNRHIQRGVSYANAMKSPDSSDEDGPKDHDDDDSYPELDDMGLEEIHPPPPPSRNGEIRWAVRNVPFKRRSQTMVVLMHSLSIALSVSIFFGLCANPFAWPLLLIYLLHVLSSKAATDGSLSYRSEWFRRSSLWHLFAGYFPAKLHKTHDLPPTRKYIFGYHPHGIISHGAWAAFATEALGFSEKFPGITNSLLTLDNNFRVPLYREYVLSMGVRSVSKESIVNILTRGGPNGEGMGRGVTVVVGGARESLEAQPGMLRLILKERKGFIKLAVRCGADLVPVLAFGENDIYDQLRPREHPWLHKVQKLILKVWKFTLPFIHGRGIFNYDVGLMPYRRPLNVVVGAPIKVRQSATVDPEEIARLHGLYVAELQKLWDTYKDEFAPGRKDEMAILS
ncbi:diacylglycerol acyltransferase-domain-containing protein [Xylariaceae sp. FL0804]|nr:diacylglycerol acyltransferase-domain-containing protein [Xylariaceae sp. FL0804]